MAYNQHMANGNQGTTGNQYMTHSAHKVLQDTHSYLVRDMAAPLINACSRNNMITRQQHRPGQAHKEVRDNKLQLGYMRMRVKW